MLIVRTVHQALGNVLMVNIVMLSYVVCIVMYSSIIAVDAVAGGFYPSNLARMEIS